MKAMELQTNHLEIAAKCWARNEAHGVKGVVIATALEQCAATVPDLSVMEQAEDYIERWLAAWLARNLLTFTSTYYRDMEERIQRAERVALDAVNSVPSGANPAAQQS